MRTRVSSARRLRLVFGAAFAALTLTPHAADLDSAQHKTVLDLAVAHVRAEFQRYPQAVLPGLDFEHPQILVRMAAQGRRLVFVSFESKLARWGQYETFELCTGAARIERIDSGRIEDVDLYRQTVSTISPATPSRLPSRCRAPIP